MSPLQKILNKLNKNSCSMVEVISLHLATGRILPRTIFIGVFTTCRFSSSFSLYSQVARFTVRLLLEVHCDRWNHSRHKQNLEEQKSNLIIRCQLHMSIDHFLTPTPPGWRCQLPERGKGMGCTSTADPSNNYLHRKKTLLELGYSNLP